MVKTEHTENKRDTKSTDIVKKRRVRHGLYSWLKTGRINPSIRGHKRLQRYLREIEVDLIRDLGSEENLTTAQEVLVKTTVQAYGCLLLAGAYTQRYSILRPDQARKGILELQPVLGKQFIAFLNTVRQNLLALGLDRKEREPLSLEDVIREHDEKAEENARAAENRATLTQERRSRAKKRTAGDEEGTGQTKVQGETGPEDSAEDEESGQEDGDQGGGEVPDLAELALRRPLTEADFEGRTDEEIKAVRLALEARARAMGLPVEEDGEDT